MKPNSFALADVGEAGGLGARSPAQARGQLSVRSIVAALTLRLAHELCSNRESGLRPDTRTAGPSGMASGFPKPKMPTTTSGNSVGCPGVWGGRRSGIKEELTTRGRQGGQPRSCPPQAPGRTPVRNQHPYISTQTVP
ncbi:MAG: hypothetical protein WAY02_02910 [Burkholderiaceae bacterium]